MCVCERKRDRVGGCKREREGEDGDSLERHQVSTTSIEHATNNILSSFTLTDTKTREIERVCGLDGRWSRELWPQCDQIELF